MVKAKTVVIDNNDSTRGEYQVDQLLLRGWNIWSIFIVSPKDEDHHNNSGGQWNTYDLRKTAS